MPTQIVLPVRVARAEARRSPTRPCLACSSPPCFSAWRSPLTRALAAPGDGAATKAYILPTDPYSEFGTNLPAKDNYNLCGQKLVVRRSSKPRTASKSTKTPQSRSPAAPIPNPHAPESSQPHSKPATRNTAANAPAAKLKPAGITGPPRTPRKRAGLW